ncbi:MAG TPA: L-2-amino-thiazoline-4-carboxylic acid hydrolase [Terracidiphilus sp.]
MSSDIELNEIGVLKRREIEARILSPILEALGNEFGRKEVIEITRSTITEIARKQGRELAEQMGTNDLESYGKSIEPWSRSGALQLRILNQDERALSFDVTACKYAELYRGLGTPELGSVLSCSRDAAFIEGFNPDITLERTQTIMQGSGFCDFRFRVREGREP